MGCCGSKEGGGKGGDKVESTAATRREAPAKNDAGTKKGVENRGFEEASPPAVVQRQPKVSEVQSPTITITTAEEVNAQFEAARRAREREEEEEAKQKREKEEAKRNEEEEEARQLREEAERAAKVQQKGDPMAKSLGADAGKRDEVDGIPLEARRESAAGVNRANRHMETIGEEEEDDDEEGSRPAPPPPPPREEPPESAVRAEPKHATLAPTKSNPTSRRISQIAPASVDSPDAVRLSNKFVMIPTAGPDTIAEED